MIDDAICARCHGVGDVVTQQLMVVGGHGWTVYAVTGCPWCKVGAIARVKPRISVPVDDRYL